MARNTRIKGRIDVFVIPVPVPLYLSATGFFVIFLQHTAIKRRLTLYLYNIEITLRGRNHDFDFKERADCIFNFNSKD